MEGELVGVVGRGAAPDALDGEEADLTPEVAVANEVQGAISVPEPVWIDLPAGHGLPGGREVAHLD